MALSENPTLEEIVDEVERLNDLIVDRGGEQIIIPTTTTQVLEKGNYKGDISVLGSSSLIPSNIKQGVDLFGVVGNLSGLKIVPGNTYTAYLNSTERSVEVNTTLNVLKTELNKDANIRFSVSMKVNPYSGAKVYLDLYKNNSLLKTFTGTGLTYVNHSYDFKSSIGDTIKANIRYDGGRNGKGYAKDIKFTFDISSL